MKIELETTRLILREFEKEDYNLVHQYASDAEVVRFMSWGPNNEEDTLNFILKALGWQQEQPRKVFDFAVVDKWQKRLIGSCGFHLARTASEGSSQAIALATNGAYNLDPLSHTRDQNGAIGYCFGKESWGKGYATEAAGAVIKYAFKKLSMHKMFAVCDVDNKASARVLEKVGMRKEGHLLEDIKIKGRWRDSYLYGLLVNEWNPLGDE